jgi:hypothetical protein
MQLMGLKKKIKELVNSRVEKVKEGYLTIREER